MSQQTLVSERCRKLRKTNHTGAQRSQKLLRKTNLTDRQKGTHLRTAGKLEMSEMMLPLATGAAAAAAVLPRPRPR